MSHFILMTTFGGMLLFGMGCNNSTTTPATEENFQSIYTKITATIEIAYRNEVTIESEGVVIGFDSLLEDSRCPEGATCVWEGNGRVRISFRQNKNKPRYAELNTGLKPKVAFFGQYAVQLVELSPYPVLNQPLEPEDYRITVKLLKREE